MHRAIWLRNLCRQLVSVPLLFALAANALLFSSLVAPSDAQTRREQLVVHSTLEPEHIAEFKQAFEAEHPGIEIVWSRDSTGVIAARIIAEGENQRADAIWGLAVTSVAKIKSLGLLVPYAPANLQALREGFRDKSDPPSWVGMEAWVAAVCFNTIEAAKYDLKRPTSWFDLLDPSYKGRVLLSNPASSGTGFFHVSGWIQMFGESKAWAFMDQLHENIAQYQHSGTKPCRDAAAGEFAVGISYELAGATLKTKGAPIDVLLMKEGGGWDMDTAAILKGTQKLELAKRLMDFAASRKANEIYAKFVSQVAIEGLARPIPNYPEGVAASMIKNDLDWAAENRDRIIREWQRRYEEKSAKK
jgi:iron(III) transport system substrate-binding protein